MGFLVGDGVTDNSRALQELLDKGGEIVIPAGDYLTGPIEVRSSTKLVLEKGATLRFIPDPALYEPVYTRWEGVKCHAMHPCFFINEAHDVVITGEGTIDGSGKPWWEEVWAKKARGQNRPESELEKKFAALNPGYETQPGGGGGRPCQFLRPALFQVKDSENILVENITVQNSPFWTVHPLFSRNITLKGLTIKNPYDSPNTDGIDVESCSDVKIIDCSVFVGDDGIALKSGSGPEGIRDNVPTTDVIIRGCRVVKAHGGAVIGSETAAGISNVVVEDCVFDDTDRGIRIKSRRGRGGALHDLVFRNLTMKNNLCPLVVNMFYKCGCSDESCFSLEKQEVTSETPSLYNVVVEGCKAEGSRASAGMIVGLPELPVRNLTVRDCELGVDPESDADVTTSGMYRGLPAPESRGLRLRYIESLTLENVKVSGTDKEILIEDSVSFA